tara:strand:- start:2426 stop:2671 length:246 start_codon:yes stop_codon:yes gene_type:complete
MISLPQIFTEALALFIVTCLVIYYILKITHKNNIMGNSKPSVEFDTKRAKINSVIISLILTIVVTIISQQVDKRINLQHKK